MGIWVFPGIHDESLTADFLAGMGLPPEAVSVFPATVRSPYSPWDVWHFLRAGNPDPAASSALTMITFSAGGVGAIAAAQVWQSLGGTIAAIIALDAWGMPAGVGFPVYRISHDPFTHWSSRLLGGASEGFYAEPAVPHLELWRSPQTTWGWGDRTHFAGFPASTRTRTTAAATLHQLLQRHAPDGYP